MDLDLNAHSIEIVAEKENEDPFRTVSAGHLRLSGRVWRYTTLNPIAFY